MIRVAVSVEGETEEAFIKKILYEELCSKGISLTPINMRGNISLDRIAPEIVRLYRKFDVVTTFYDFYGFKKSNRYIDGDDLEGTILRRVVRTLERQGHSFDQRKVRPYIQMHEFEGLLFSNVDAFAILSRVDDDNIRKLRCIRQSVDSPEDINNSPSTAPSKRLLNADIGYDKVKDGPNIALKIGLSNIRRECHRFNEWMTWLESLGEN